ncbi:LLM class flavin-dependent oxidoreductase [Rhodospirillales bacterium]|jgi:luciferase family oxidoreductase group 1|nr:LLM class flavin-dependent oxidoreductase [Rhodospirillales bacterium]
MLKLSVLDQSIAAEGVSEAQSIRDTIALAKRCEDLGYARFWVSEHHNHPTIVGTAPEIMMAAIGQSTSRIRIGSAGVMLPHYAPFKVAEQFRVLDAIAPGRIDLGLGRAPGSDQKTAYAMNPNAGQAAEHFPENVRDLMAWVTDEPLIDRHPHTGLVAHPKGETSPDVWMLGTSDYGAQVAAYFGLPYCFAHFITDGQGVERAFSVYRENYKPSPRFPEPIANVCVWALAAETQEDATRLFSPRAHWKARRDYGELRNIQSSDAIKDFDYSPPEQRRMDNLYETAIYGTAPDVYARLQSLATKLDIDEVVILTWTHAQQDRERSYELLAAEMNKADA